MRLISSKVNFIFRIGQNSHNLQNTQHLQQKQGKAQQEHKLLIYQLQKQLPALRAKAMGASASKAAGEVSLTAREVLARRKVAADIQAVKSNAAFPKVTNPTNIDLFINPDGGKKVGGKEADYDLPIAQPILSQIEKWDFVRVTTASGKPMTRKEDMAKWVRIQEEKAMDERFGRNVHKVDNRLSEKQLVDMFTRLRDLKGYTVDEASKDYGLSKDIVQMLVRTASLPDIPVDEDLDEAMGKSKKISKG